MPKAEPTIRQPGTGQLPKELEFYEEADLFRYLKALETLGVEWTATARRQPSLFEADVEPGAAKQYLLTIHS